MTNNLIIRNADWIQDNHSIKQIRRLVFINEQDVPENMEWDNEDVTALHCIAILNGNVVATGRLQEDGQLGRMAVLKEFRNQGIGSKILQHLLQQKTPDQTLFLNAQTQAVNFYKKFNFSKDGNEFIEAGIPHFLMTRHNDN